MQYFYHGEHEWGQCGVIVNDNLEIVCYLILKEDSLDFCSDASGSPFSDEEEYMSYVQFMCGQEIFPGHIWDPRKMAG